MSVEQLEKIDFIGVNDETGELSIGISDHLPWIPADEHLDILQTKINNYLNFIENGQIYESYPDAKGRKIVITVLVKYSLTKEALIFIEKITSILKDAGYSLRVEQV